MNYKRLFTNYLDSEGIRYDDTLREDVVKIVYEGENLKSIPVLVFFDEDGENMAQFKCFDIINFNNNVEAGIKCCNKVNNDYRWVKYFIDEDNDIICAADTYFDANTVGDVCLRMVRRVVNITDDVFAEFSKAKWQ